MSFDVTPIFSEYLIGDFVCMDEETNILIQAIMSIEAILKQDPPAHEKVF